MQSEVLEGSKEMIRDVIIRKLDIKIMLSSSNTFRITEFGCSVGPNTFSAMQHVVEAVKDKAYNNHQFTNNIPEFQVFFNDHVTNDFNTLFQSLPVDKSYYASGVPGSFHGRLLPSRSIHFAHSSCTIHWLSKCPEELLDDKSPAWNKGLIHYVGASNIEVVNAYVAQFEKDMEMFFKRKVPHRQNTREMLDNLKLRQVITNILKILEGASYQVTHCFREANSVGDYLAKLASSNGSKTLYDSHQSLPREVKGLVQLDKWQLPIVRKRYEKCNFFVS
ncbi:loganic acid O-methyltransferase-like [Lycium barbarum]|uniref:loganic acid O-methyltransferase-like n=1 Tax=Lycium barbarum TaxID=112863 RepID=UPI00293E78B4|nr:loganic acid O-methyltransferase-like [Lycium barbarum]